MSYSELKFSLTFVVIAAFMSVSFAVTRVNIDEVQLNPIPIAVPYFNNGDSKSAKYIYDIVVQDLTNTSLFKVIKRAPQDLTADIKSNLAVWKDTSASMLIKAEYHTEKNDLFLNLDIWDLFYKRKLFSKEIPISGLSYRKAAHNIANVIYEELTGDKGYFNSKIVFVSFENPEKKQKRRISIMDYDGANLEYVNKGGYLMMSPRIDPKMQKLLYLSYVNPNAPKVKILDLKTNKEETVGSFPGMTFAPRFSSTDNEVLLSYAKKGATNIYRHNLVNGQSKQITKCNSICTSPSESPDGKKIVFNSDMSGRRHLFTMNKGGSEIKRISFGKGFYTTPVWSPRGDLIAFTKSIAGEGFYIGVMNPDGSRERLIAQGWLVEGPSWSPNGRLILFEKAGQKGNSSLYSVDISGNFIYPIQTPVNAVDANWVKQN